MPKLITDKHLGSNQERARNYVKAYILYPSGFFGLACMVAGTASLGYQLVATDTYTWTTFAESFGLLLLGGVLGWIQTRYHQHVLRDHPGIFASRMKPPSAKRAARQKKEPRPSSVDDAGPSWLPFAYLAGMAMLLTASTVSVWMGHVHGIAAYLMPWGGFFWSKLFFWRTVLKEGV
jgi:hypothetical protein